MLTCSLVVTTFKKISARVKYVLVEWSVGLNLVSLKMANYVCWSISTVLTFTKFVSIFLFLSVNNDYKILIIVACILNLTAVSLSLLC